VNGLLCENTCSVSDDWVSLGCDVVDATTVTGLGEQKAAEGWLSCEITCPDNNGEFVVVAVANTCIAKDEWHWMILGCDVAGTPDMGLGEQKAVEGWLSCEITCPVNGGEFVVDAAKSEGVEVTRSASLAPLPEPLVPLAPLPEPLVPLAPLPQPL